MGTAAVSCLGRNPGRKVRVVLRLCLGQFLGISKEYTSVDVSGRESLELGVRGSLVQIQSSRPFFSMFSRGWIFFEKRFPFYTTNGHPGAGGHPVALKKSVSTFLLFRPVFVRARDEDSLKIPLPH